jgi:hypothetical protein
VLVLLLIRNGFLFTTRLDEGGDSGANSILIEQAKRFTLLVGNYSREGFNHPGPAYLYAQAFGEAVFHDFLHLVPAPWNGQLLAVFILDSAFVAITVGIVYGWTRSLGGAALCLSVVLLFAAVHPDIINSGWMPDLYVPTFLAFLAAAASVAAGNVRDLWAFTVTGWFLIHGQACFLLFVPVIALAVLVAVGLPHRGHPLAATAAFLRTHRRSWAAAVAISAVFALPMVLELVLHWPGNFGKYVGYGSSKQAGGHSAGQVARYVLWFWAPPHGFAWAVPVLGYAVAVTAALTLTGGLLRRCLIALLSVDAVATATFVFYVVRGVDEISAYYIGYFFWCVPFLTLLVPLVAVADRVGRAGAGRRRFATAAAAVACLAVFAVLAVVPGLRTSTRDDDPGLPGAVAALAARAGGRTIVAYVDQGAWIDATGFLVQAERTHVRVCVDQPGWTFMFSRQFICSPRQAAIGVAYHFVSPVPAGGPAAVLRFGHTVVLPSGG